MKHVMQKTDSDCAVATLSMYTDMCYDQIIKVIDEYKIKIPISTNDSMRILKILGYSPVRLHTWVWQSRCIVSVPSLNFPSKNHSVVWSGNCSRGEVFDPQHGRVMKSFYSTQEFIGCRAWSNIIADLRDETVKMFAEMENKEMSDRLKNFNLIKRSRS